jgi:hypothetical protein
VVQLSIDKDCAVVEVEVNVVNRSFISKGARKGRVPALKLALSLMVKAVRRQLSRLVRRR